MRTRLLSILLSCALLLTLLPAAPARAEDVQTPTSITFGAAPGSGGDVVDAENGKYYKNDGSEGTSSDYNFAYLIEDPDGDGVGVGVITLRNYDRGYICYRVNPCGTMRLVLIGENTVSSGWMYGVNLLDADLTVEGSGSLSVNVDEDSTAHGVYLTWGGGTGSLTLRDSVDVSVTASSETGNSYGIYAGAALTVQDNAKLSVRAVSESPGYAYARAVYLFGGPTTLDISTTQPIVFDGENTASTPESGHGEGWAISATDNLTFRLTNCPSLTLRGRNSSSCPCCLAYPESVYETPPTGYMATLTNMENSVEYRGARTEGVLSPDTRVAVDPPVKAENLIYNGYEQTGVPAGTGYTLTGTFAATNAGSYSVTATPDAGCKWSDDNSSGARSYTWRIAKATPTAEHFNLPELIKPYCGIGISVEKPTVREPYTGMGNVGSSTYGESVPNGSLPVEVGEYPVTFQVSEGSNFTAANVLIGTLHIIKAENPVRTAGGSEYTRTKNGGTIKLGECLYNPQGEVSWSITQALHGCSVDDAGVFTVGDTAGDCVVTATAAGNEHYESGSVSWIIHVTEKAAEDLTVSYPSGVEYGSALPDPTYTAPKGTLSTTVSYESAHDDRYPKSAEKPTECGYYRVSVVCETADTIYSGSAYFTIRARSISSAAITFGTQAVYDGTEKDVVIGSVTLGGKTLTPDVDYTINAGGSATNVGDTRLTIQGIGNYNSSATASWSLRKATPTAADFMLYEISARDYTGEPVSLYAPWLAEKSGAGDVTVLYDGSAEPPVNAGDYAVTFDVAEGMNFTAASGLAWGTLTIRKTADPFTFRPISVASGETVDLTRYVTGNVGALRFAIAGDARDCTVTPAGIFTAGSLDGGTVTVRVTAAESANHVETTKDVSVKLIEPTTRVTDAYVSGTTLTWSAVLPAGKRVTAIAAWYDSYDRMLGCTAESFTAAGTVTDRTLTVGAGASWYRLMIVDESFAPICKSWGGRAT